MEATKKRAITENRKSEAIHKRFSWLLAPLKENEKSGANNFHAYIHTYTYIYTYTMKPTQLLKMNIKRRQMAHNDIFCKYKIEPGKSHTKWEKYKNIFDYTFHMSSSSSFKLQLDEQQKVILSYYTCTPFHSHCPQNIIVIWAEIALEKNSQFLRLHQIRITFSLLQSPFSNAYYATTHTLSSM